MSSRRRLSLFRMSPARLKTAESPLHTIPQVNELRELLRTTAERMEFEAAQLRWQLELLETSTRPAWYH